MRKEEFLTALRRALSGLAEADVAASLAFYDEMISDRMEDGCTEEEAVAQMGAVDALAKEIIAQTPLVKIVGEKIKPQRRLGVLEIVLLVLGSPVWLSLAIAAIAVGISLYAVLWSVIVSLWAVFASLIGSALGLLAAGGAHVFGGNTAVGFAMLGGALALCGIAIFAFFGSRAATKGILLLTKKSVFGIKKLFLKGGSDND